MVDHSKFNPQPRNKWTRLIAGLLTLLLASGSPPTYALRSEAKQEQTGKGAGLEEIVTALLEGNPSPLQEAATHLITTPSTELTPPVSESPAAGLEEGVEVVQHGHPVYRSLIGREPGRVDVVLLRRYLKRMQERRKRVALRILPLTPAEDQRWQASGLGFVPSATLKDLLKQLEGEAYPSELLYVIRLEESSDRAGSAGLLNQRLWVPFPPRLKIPGLPSMEELVVVSVDAPNFEGLTRGFLKPIQLLRDKKAKRDDLKALLKEMGQLLKMGALRLENLPAFPRVLPDREAKERFSRKTDLPEDRMASEAEILEMEERAAVQKQQVEQAQAARQREERVNSLATGLRPKVWEIRGELLRQASELSEPDTRGEMERLIRDQIHAKRLIRSLLPRNGEVAGVFEKAQAELDARKESLKSRMELLMEVHTRKEPVSEEERMIDFLSRANGLLARSQREAIFTSEGASEGFEQAGRFLSEMPELGNQAIHTLSQTVTLLHQLFQGQPPEDEAVRVKLRLLEAAAVANLAWKGELSEESARAFVEDARSFQASVWDFMWGKFRRQVGKGGKIQKEVSPRLLAPLVQKREVPPPSVIYATGFYMLVLTSRPWQFEDPELRARDLRALALTAFPEWQKRWKGKRDRKIEADLSAGVMERITIPPEHKVRVLLPDRQPYLMDLAVVLLQTVANLSKQRGYFLNSKEYAKSAKAVFRPLAEDYPNYQPWYPTALAGPLAPDSPTLESGLEETAVAVTAADRLEELVSELGSRVTPVTEGTRPLRILVDTNQVGPNPGDSRVLRLAELGVRLKLEEGLPIEVAGLATPEELAAGLEQLPDEVNRNLLRARTTTYQAGNPESHQSAMTLLKIAFPEFERLDPITTVDEKTIQWFLAGMEELGVPPESFTPEFREQIESFLTSRHAA